MIENFKNIIDNSDELFTIFFTLFDENGVDKEHSIEFTNWATFDLAVAIHLFCTDLILYIDLFILIFFFGYYFKRSEDKKVLFNAIMYNGYVLCATTLGLLI